MTDAEKIELLITAIGCLRGWTDPYFNGHEKRVAHLCTRFSDHLRKQRDYSIEITDKFIANLDLAARYHDMAKVIITDAVLNKPSRLTSDEMRSIQEHSPKGADVLDAVGVSRDIANIVRFHHERWNGAGYPDGIKELDIPLGARILCIVDYFDALTNKRSYKKRVYAMSGALKKMSAEAGRTFDPALYAEFIKMIEGEE